MGIESGLEEVEIAVYGEGVEIALQQGDVRAVENFTGVLKHPDLIFLGPNGMPRGLSPSTHTLRKLT